MSNNDFWDLVDKYKKKAVEQSYGLNTSTPGITSTRGTTPESAKFWETVEEYQNDRIAEIYSHGAPHPIVSGADQYWKRVLGGMTEEPTKRMTQGLWDDFTPVKEDEGGLEFFQRSKVFDDGYDFGDVSKTILGTAGDVGLGVVKGAGKTLEGVAKLISYGVAGAADLFGADEYAEGVRERTKINVIDLITEPASHYLDKASVLGRTSDAVAEGVGQLGLIAVTGGAGAAAGLGTAGTTALTTGLTAASSMGSGMSEAYQGGATDEEAFTYGAIAGTADALTELIFGGLGKAVNATGLSVGLSSADDVLAKKVSSLFTDQIAKNFAEYGIKAGAEGFEEVLAGVAQGIGKKLTYMDEEELSAILADENLLEQFVVGAVTSGLYQSGGIPGTRQGSLIEANQTGRDFITGLTQNEQTVVDKEYETRLAEAEKDGKLTGKEKAKLYDRVVEEMDKGYISTDTIEEVLGGETYKRYQDTVKAEDDLIQQEKSLTEESKKLEAMVWEKMTGEQQVRRDELRGMLPEIRQKLADMKETSTRDQLKSKLGEEVMNLAQGSRLMESYNEVGRRKQAFEADLSQYDAKQQEVIKKAVESGILNNTNRTHEFVDFIAKVSADKGVLFDFTNNAKLKESGFAVDGKFVNGYVTKYGVTVNIQSAKSLNSVVGHEITHVLEGTDLYTELQSAVTEYAKTKGDYQSRYNAIAKLYEGVEGANIDAELTADLVGDYLFTDSDFISKLSTEHRNVFQKIFDEVKYLLKTATAGSKEAQQLEKVKRAFEKAYRATKNTAENSGVQYSISETTDGRFAAVVDNDILSNIDTSTWDKATKKKVQKATKEELKKFSEGFSINGIEFVGTKGVRDEYTRSNYSEALANHDQNAYLDKMRASAVLDDVIQVATEWKNDNKLKHVREDYVDFVRGNTLIKSGDNTYRAVVLAGITSDGRAIFHDVVDVQQEHFEIKKLESSTAASANESPNAILEDSNTNKVAQKEGNVNGEFAPAEVTEEQNNRGLDAKSEVRYSLSHDTEYMDKAISKNSSMLHVSNDAMSDAKAVRERIADRMNEIKDRGLVGLPEDIEGNTYIANSSYDGTEENTTICPRSLAAEAFTDAVSEYLGRPLTVEEQIYISQDLQGRSLTPECTYCYVATDRKAYRAFLGEYINQRDAVIEKVKENPSADISRNGELYKEFLGGRKDTNPMYSRFKMWVDAYRNGKPMVEASNLANISKLMGDINSTFGAELKPQITDAMKYAQSASWAKKRVNYVAYNGHILNWKQSRIDKLNSHYGLRMYSFSDFHPAFVLENMQMITDASVRGLKMLGYTKDTDFVEIFAPTGMNINVSTFGFETGGNVYENNIIGAEWERAKALREQYPNVGISFVATNDHLVNWALDQDWIDVVVPYHLVRTGAEVAKAFGYTNYTSESADTKGAGWAKGKDQKYIAPTEHNNDKATYMAALESNHLNPRFARFIDNPNYMKLVNESRQPASKSKPVQPVFNEDAAMVALAKLEANGFYQPIGGSVERMYEIAAEVAEDMGKQLAPAAQHSLSDINDSPNEYGDYNVYGEDVALETDEIAPVAESAADNTQENAAFVEENDTIAAEDSVEDLFPDDTAALQEEYEQLVAQRDDLLDAMNIFAAVDDIANAERMMNELGTVQERIDEIEADESDRLSSIREADEPVTMDSRPEDVADNVPLTKSMVAELAKDIRSRLALPAKRVAEVRDLIARYSAEEFPSRAHLYEEIQERFGSYTESYVDEDLKGVKALLRTYGIAVDENIKRDIADYGQLMRSNFGKVRFSKDGLPVDVAYMEFQEVMPGLFPESIDVPADQLLRIIEVANMDVASEQTQPIDSETLEEVTNLIANRVTEFKQIRKEALANKHGRESFQSLMEDADQYVPPVRVNTSAPTRAEMTASPDDIAPVFDTTSGQQALMPEPEPAAEAPKAITRKQLHENIVDDITTTFREKGYEFTEVLKKAKDLSTFATVDNTPQRVMEKALGYKEGQILADMTVNKVAQNETEGIRWLNSFTDKKSGLLAKISKQYGIKPGSKQSAAAQMYAEGFYVGENDAIIAYGDAELAKDFPDAKVQENIKKLARDPRIRMIYDETLAAINESRTRNAYPEIPRLDNYFLHFRAMEDTFSRLGLPFNPNDIRAKDLPTDLNGVTADLKPGQPYFASAMHRKGKRTSFDLLGGLEKYLTSAKNQIYHIDDIQTLRALRNYVAETYGQAHGLENLDTMSNEEAEQRIEEVYNSHLSTFAKFLNEEANVLAGKTSLIDRGLEGVIGRRGMTFMDTLNRQVGANMVGFNVSSSLTNFLAPVQAFAKTNKFDFVKAMAQTAANKIGSIAGRGDSFVEDSPVMIRRKGAERFYRTPWEKAADKGYIFMSMVDDLSTEIIARTKYNEFTRKGMDSQQAHIETDKWVSRLMGDRSLGQQPQIYNSKTLGLITKFQLEVRNQLDSMFYDTIQEAKVSTEQIENKLLRNAKKAAKITSTFAQLAVMQHLFGKAFESIAGYNPAFDIIDVLIKTFGWDDEEDDEDTVLDNIEEGFLALLGDLPYTSTLTGGRIPIASALPVTELIKGVDQYGNEKSRWDTIKEAAPYYFLPGGYGQIKKTKAGLEMFSEEHPVAGSYTDSGNLRFPVEDTNWNRVQAGLFGQWASENARDYFDNERKPMKENQIEEFLATGMEIQDYWDYREGLSEHDTLEEKVDYIAGLDLPVGTKNILVNNLTDRKESIDLTEYDEYGGLEEMDFAMKYPDKYEVAEAVGGYQSYMQYQEDMKGMKLAEKADYIAGLNLSTEQKNLLINSETDRKEPIDLTGYENYSSFEEFEFAKKNPEKYALAKAVGGYDSYTVYADVLGDITSDKDEWGQSINGSRKPKVYAYIYSLDIPEIEQHILFKSQYPSTDDHNYEIIDYLNQREDISYDEMVAILLELDFKVSSDGMVRW